MKESRTSNSIKNGMSGLFFRLIGIFCPFFIRTIMIQKLGVEYIGLSQLFTSILQMLSLTELGIGNAMIYSMYRPISENDNETLCALLALYRKFYSIIGCVITVLGLGLLPFLPKIIKGEYPNDINIYLLYLIFLLNTSLSYFMFAYKKSLLDAHQKLSVENMLHSVCSLVMYCLQIVVLLMGANYYIYIIFLPLSTFAINIWRNKVVAKMYPELVCQGEVSHEIKNEIFSKIKALIGYQIGNKVLWFSDSIVISKFLGLEILAIYSNYYYIMNAVIGIVSVVHSSILAGVGNSIVVDSKDKNYNDFMKFNFGNASIISFCAVSLLCLYQPFMKIWVGSDLMFSNPVMILFVMYFYFWLFNKIGSTYTSAAGLWKEQFYKPYVSAGVNLVLNIILVQIIGIAGVLISTVIASVFVDTIWETWAIFKYLFCRKPYMYIFRLLEYSVITIFICFISSYLCSFINTTGFFQLILNEIVVVGVFVIVWTLIHFKTKEFKDCLKLVTKLVRK